MSSFPSDILGSTEGENAVPQKVPDGFHELMKNIEVIDHLKSKID